MVLGLIVAYMVLASQFNAFTHPFTVLLALPFSVSGALIALWLAGQSLNVYSMLGIILLMGIAKKNSILLVDFTNQVRAQGMERHEALLHACPVRLRPILMTSIATIAGALPPALALGPGAELQRPMALSIVGGMIVSTALTLFVVPAAYSLLDDAVEWNAGAGARTPRSSPRCAPRVTARRPGLSRSSAAVPRSRDALGLVAFLALSFGVLVLGARAVSPGLVDWYPGLHKPAWTPPSWVFGPVWALLYPAMAVAGWRAWREAAVAAGRCSTSSSSR